MITRITEQRKSEFQQGIKDLISQLSPEKQSNLDPEVKWDLAGLFHLDFDPEKEFKGRLAGKYLALLNKLKG